jgi:hypothetical protein
VTLGRVLTEPLQVPGPLPRRASPEDARRFDEATELVTWSWSEFHYAMHFGETIEEYHMFNLIRFNRTGDGLLSDRAKGSCAS